MNTTSEHLVRATRRAALGLGSSLGNRRQILENTIRKLDAHPDIDVVRVSQWVRTPPMAGGAAKNWFLNGVAVCDIRIEPHAFLRTCAALERRAGRRDGPHWGDRPLDLDVLIVDDLVIDSEDLILPHPSIAQRAFVLGPLLQVWPSVLDPQSNAPFASRPMPAGPKPIDAGLLARTPLLRYL